jgi:hypothetical protein
MPVHQSRGLSWRAAAVVAVAVVVALAGISVLYRPEPAPEPRPEVAVVPTPRGGVPTAVADQNPQPSPTLPMRTPGPTPTPNIAPPPPLTFGELSFGPDALALIARIDGRLYMDILNEETPGSFTGIFRLPFPSNSPGTYRFDFVQVWTKDERVRNYVEIGRWDVDLTVLEEGTNASGQVLSFSAAARQRPRAAPRAVRRGYSIVVDAESRYSYGVINVAVEFGQANGAESALRP